MVFCVSSCDIFCSPTPTVYENMTMLRAYYNEYILPDNPEAKIEETHYYQFLLRVQDDEYESAFFVAWNVDENSEEWELNVSNFVFLFSHEVEFLVYRFGKKCFISVPKAFDEKLLNIKQLTSSFESMTVFISSN